MKNTIFICLLLLLSGAAGAQAFFFSTYRPKEAGVKYDCQSARDYKLEEIADYKTYQVKYSEFYKAHNGEWPYTVFLRADKPFIIYTAQAVRKWEKCTYTFIDCAQGNSLQEVQEIIRKRRAENKFDSEKILHTHDPKGKANTTNVIEKRYGALYVKFISGTTAQSQASVAQFKNQSTDYAVVVTLGLQSKEPRIIELQPQAGAAINLQGNTDYSMQIFVKKPDEKRDNRSWVDWIKEQVKGHVTKDPDYQEKIEVRSKYIGISTTVAGPRA